MDMFTPTYCQCFVLQSQALPASSAIGPYFLAPVPLASIPSTALINLLLHKSQCDVFRERERGGGGGRGIGETSK